MLKKNSKKIPFIQPVTVIIKFKDDTPKRNLIMFCKLLQESTNQYQFFLNLLAYVYRKRNTNKTPSFHILKHIQTMPTQTLTTFYDKASYQKNKIQICYLQSIRWPNLLRIDLYNCQIEAVEALSFLDMPNLKILTLLDNVIVNAQPFGKTNFKNLQQLRLYRNKVQIFDKYMIRMRSGNLNLLNLLQQCTPGYSHITISKFSLFFRMECKGERIINQRYGYSFQDYNLILNKKC